LANLFRHDFNTIQPVLVTRVDDFTFPRCRPPDRIIQIVRIEIDAWKI